MSAVSTLFEQFLRERRYLKNVTPKTVVWYQTGFQAFTRTVSVEGLGDLSKPLLHEFVVALRERGLRIESAHPSPASRSPTPSSTSRLE